MLMLVLALVMVSAMVSMRAASGVGWCWVVLLSRSRINPKGNAILSLRIVAPGPRVFDPRQTVLVQRILFFALSIRQP